MCYLRLTSRGLSPQHATRESCSWKDPVCAWLSLPSEGGAGVVTLSLACDLPWCLLRCTAGGLLGVGGQCEVVGGGDRGVSLPTSAMPTAGCKVGEGRRDPETLLQTVMLAPGQPFFPDRRAGSLGRPSFWQDSWP